MTENYEVLVPDFYPEVTESSPLFEVKTAVEKGEISLEEGGVKRLTAEEGLYYYTVVKSRSLTGMDLYEVHFINMSNLYDFEKNLSQMLLLIMSVSLLLTVILGYCSIQSSYTSEKVYFSFFTKSPSSNCNFNL